MSRKHAIPLIDLSASPGAGDIEAVCRSAGCFNVADAGIDPALTDALLDEMADFFDLPDDHPVKRAVHRSQNQGANGWTPMLEEPAYEAGTIAWVESFDCGLSRQRMATLPAATLGGVQPSIWPQIPGFRDVVRAHWDALIQAANRLYPLMSAVLKQEAGFLAARASSQVLNTMRLLNYPKFQSLPDDMNRGISAHTDFECITLIHQTAPGLEVQGPDGEWRQPPVARGQWTVLIGDMIERWSNGAFKATAHRVPTTKWARRSIVMFLAADPGLEVRPLGSFVDADNPPKFEAATQDGLIGEAMARAEANRQAMLPQVEKLRSELPARISPG